MSWEAIATADLAVIVLDTMDRRTQAADDPAVKRNFFANDPVANELSAVKAGHRIEMDAYAMRPPSAPLAAWKKSSPRTKTLVCSTDYADKSIYPLSGTEQRQ